MSEKIQNSKNRLLEVTSEGLEVTSEMTLQKLDTHGSQESQLPSGPSKREGQSKITGMSARLTGPFKIYKIINQINNKVYVGQTSQSLKNRFRDHCKPSSKFCFLLRRAIDKYGKNAFKIELLEETPTREEANLREVFWIERLRSKERDFGYNVVMGGIGWSGKHSEESKKIMSERMKGEKNPNWGKPKSASWKACISAIMSNRPVSLEKKQKISKALTGRKRGPTCDAVKRKISEAQKGKPRNQRFFTKRVRCIQTGKVYDSVKQACEELGLPKSSKSKVASVCRGVRKHTGGYSFEYVPRHSNL
jgi:group I intron endonuclease